jgi:hypothetical protein
LGSQSGGRHGNYQNVYVGKSERIETIDWIVAGVAIFVYAAVEANRVFIQEAAGDRIVISGSVVVKAGGAVELPGRIPIPVGCTSRRVVINPKES